MNHSFNIEYACQYGIEEAILIENFSFWIIKNKANKANTREIEIDGKKCMRTFTYNSASAMTELFPYLTQKQIYRVMESLISQGVLVRKYFNQNTYNRTSWYCFVDEDHFTKSGNAIPKKEKSILPNREMDFTKSGNHYTDINTDNKPDINTDSQEPDKIKSLTEQLKDLASDNSIAYTEDVNQDRLFQNKLMSEIANCTNDKILERANQYIAIRKNPKAPTWINSDKFGFKFLKFNWDRIEIEYNVNKQKSNVVKFERSEKEKPVFDSTDFDKMKGII